MSTLHAYFVETSGQLYFDIDITIDNKMIRTFMFNAEAEEISIDRAFCLCEAIKDDKKILY